MAKIGDTAAEYIAGLIGLFFCFLVLAGGFGLGSWLGPILGWKGNPDMAGLLSALSLLWLYEHHTAEHRYARLEEILETLGAGKL